MRVRIGAMSMALVGVAALLLVCCGVPSLRVEAAFNAPVATAPAAAAAAGGSGYAHLGARADSELLRSLTTFELVTIASPQLSLTHKRSIARDALQPHLLSSHAQAQRLPRRFSKRVSLSFQSERHTVRKTVMSVETGRRETVQQPKQFDLELQHLSDLFHPSYSTTAQVWRDGVRYPEEEVTKPLSEVDHCYYGSPSPTPSSYWSLSTCAGGFQGFVRDQDTVWLIEPAHLHFEEQHIKTQLQTLSARNKNRRAARNQTAHTMAVNAQEANEEEEELHASHLHVLFRAEDVDREEYMCTVGATQAQKDEYVRTGRAPAGSEIHAKHTLAVERDGGEDAHAGHSHKRGNAHSSSYSTWLAATDPEFTSRLLEQEGHDDSDAHEEDASAATEEDDDALIDGARAKKSKIVRHGKTAFTVASTTQAVTSPFAEQRRAAATIAVADDDDDDDEESYTVPHNGGRKMKLTALASSLKYVELLVVNDFQRYSLRGPSTQTDSEAIVAHLKTTYEATTGFSPSITVVLIGQITWIDGDPYTVAHGQCSACLDNDGVSVDELLKVWNQWRSNSVNTAPYAFHDNGHLFSGYAFEKPTLGYAGVGAMCTTSISGGIESLRDPSPQFNAIIVAHEMGHNFGMSHDGSNSGVEINNCPPSGMIMNSVLKAPTPTKFSTCSIDYQQNFFATSHIKCLDNVPTSTYGDPICGDGFVQEGEQCDCGDKVSCQKASSRDPCCNATSCSFIKGASCSAMNGCCDNCQITPAAAKKVCRAAANSCDLPEICPGETEMCPEDKGYAPGTTCSAGQYGPGLCYLNTCLSYLQQCRTSGANFPGAPFDTCVQQARLNQGQYCGTLWCSSVPGQCTFFRQQGVLVGMADGVPCPNSDGDYVMQCHSGQCVSSDALNTQSRWNATGWSVCTSCEQLQYQNVTCTSKISGEQVDDALCSPSSKPGTERQCINEAIGCYGAAGADSDIINIFGLMQFSRRVVMFSTLGASAAFLILLGCCYQAVTFQGENEELPTLAGEKGLKTTGKLMQVGSGMETGATVAAVAGASAAGASSAGTASGKSALPGTTSSKKKRRKKRTVQQQPLPVPV